MAPEKPERDSFLAAVEAKIAAWKAVADSYRAAKSLDGPLGDLPASGQPIGQSGGPPIDLPVGVFRDKSLKEAIPIYLEAGRRKQTNKEIATGLQTGGFHTTADNFEATVATALYRLKNEGTILRFPDGWDLAASYPGNLRTRLEKDANPKKKRARKATSRVGRNSRVQEQQQVTAKKRAKSAATVTVEQAISVMLDDGKAYAPKTIAIATGMNPASVRKKLQEMMQQGKVRQNQEGAYGLVPSIKLAG